jgi:hypothetical protein
VDVNQSSYAVETPWTWRERLRFKLFPTQHCDLPKAPAVYKDVVVVRTVVSLSALDRLRVLLSGRLTVETRTVTEHLVGGSLTASVAYPSLPEHW